MDMTLRDGIRNDSADRRQWREADHSRSKATEDPAPARALGPANSGCEQGSRPLEAQMRSGFQGNYILVVGGADKAQENKQMSKRITQGYKLCEETTYREIREEKHRWRVGLLQYPSQETSSRGGI